MLQGRRWLPEQADARAGLIFLHGIASHGAWFAETAAFLAEHGIAVYAPDRRGSGLSGGPRGHISGYEQAIADAELCLDSGRPRAAGPAAVLDRFKLGRQAGRGHRRAPAGPGSRAAACMDRACFHGST